MVTIYCSKCNKESPPTEEEDEVVDAAVDAGWTLIGNNEEDADLCPECQPPGSRCLKCFAHLKIGELHPLDCPKGGSHEIVRTGHLPRTNHKPATIN